MCCCVIIDMNCFLYFIKCDNRIATSWISWVILVLILNLVLMLFVVCRV